MGYINPDFTQIDPSGRNGDQGNDGYIKDKGIYYQVYAPKNVEKGKTIKKMKEDFNKLYTHWNNRCPIKEFYFVINDKYTRYDRHIDEAIDEIGRTYQIKTGIIDSKKLEHKFFTLDEDIIDFILGNIEQKNSENDFFGKLVDEITENMRLKDWERTSSNLIANSIEYSVLEGFSDTSMLISTTEFKNTIPSLERSINYLVEKIDALVSHFRDSKFTCLADNKIFRRDMSWRSKQVYTKDEYDIIYDKYEEWRKTLFMLHNDLAYALNLFSDEVRNHINPNYLDRKKFYIYDDLGNYNNLISCIFEPIPPKKTIKKQNNKYSKKH